MKIAEMSLKKQFLSVFATHIYMTGISIVFGFGAFWWFLAQGGWKQLFSYVFMAVYFGGMYVKAHKIGAHDKKGYALTKAYPFKGFVLALPICAATFVLWCLYRAAWIYMSGDAGLTGILPSAVNAVFLFWTFPFNGIMVPYKGGFFWYAHILIYALPAISLGAGYFAGSRNFSIYDKVIYPHMYERKK